jgi:hypothetical protein
MLTLAITCQVFHLWSFRQTRRLLHFDKTFTKDRNRTVPVRVLFWAANEPSHRHNALLTAAKFNKKNFHKFPHISMYYYTMEQVLYADAVFEKETGRGRYAFVCLRLSLVWPTV